MLEVGSSAKNKEKAKRTAEMPMWFRPSGAFGIGLQSGFLLSEQFTLITYSIIDQQKLKITFNKERNNVLLEKLTSKNLKYGTEFIIEIKIDEIPSRLSHSFSKDEELDNIYLNFDIMDPDLSSVEIFNIKQKIADFFKHSGIQSNQITRTNTIQESYFDSDEQVIINNVRFGDFEGYQVINFFFRGQDFHDLSPKFPCISFDMDFYHTTSDKFLTYNREKIKPEVKNETYKKTIRILKKYIENKFDQLNETDQIYASFSYITYLADKKYDDIPSKFKEKAFLFPVSIDNKSIILKDLIDNIKSDIISEISMKRGSCQDATEPDNINNCIKNRASEQLFSLIKIILTKDNLYYSEVICNSDYNMIKFCKEDIQPVSNQKFKSIIQQKNGSKLSSIGCRKVFPAWQEYRKLAVKKKFSWVDLYPHNSYQNDYLVLPLNFKYKTEDSDFYDFSDMFNQWIYDHRKNLNVSFEEIKTLNIQLIQYIKGILDES